MLYFLNQDNIDGQTGPIAGNDIAVYHVNTDFKLGKEVLVKVDNDPISLPILDSSEPYIWPACLPKEDDDQYFEQSDHPRKHKNRVNAMLAGWLDSPPISQAFINILGSALGEADVLRLK